MTSSISALFFLPHPPGTTSPSATYTSLTNHIAQKFSTSQASLPLPPYTLDHRIFVSTISLVPSPNTPPRQYTQLLTIPHLNPTRTYVGSSSSNTSSAALDVAIITVPTGHDGTEPFTTFLVRKLQPLWLPRSSVRIENGFAMSPLDGVWDVRFGEITAAGGSAGAAQQGQVAQGQASAGQQARGTLVEVQYHGEWDEDLTTGEDVPNGDDNATEAATEPVLSGQEDNKVNGGTAAAPDPMKSPSASKIANAISIADQEQSSRESLLRAFFFQGLLRDCPGLPVKNETGRGLDEEAWRVLVDLRSPSSVENNTHGEERVEGLVKLYMEVLRLAR